MFWKFVSPADIRHILQTAVASDGKLTSSSTFFDQTPVKNVHFLLFVLTYLSTRRVSYAVYCVSTRKLL